MAMGDVSRRLANNSKVYKDASLLISELEVHWKGLQDGLLKIEALHQTVIADDGEYYPNAFKKEIFKMIQFLNTKIYKPEIVSE